MTNILEIDPVTKKKFYKAGTDMLFKSVFSDERNKDLLEKILEVTVGKKVKIIKGPLMQEVIKPNISTKKRTLDVLVEDENKVQYNIEINMSNYSTLSRRNASFIFGKYVEDIKEHETYDKMHTFIQINLTSGLPKDYPERCIYKLIDKESGREYIDNLTIYEYNLDKLGKICYNEGKKEYKILAALICGEKDLHKICKGDKLLEKLESEVMRMNSDRKFVGLMSEEEEAEKLQNTLISEAKEEGLAEGSKQEKMEIAKNMLKDNIPTDTIIKYTGLTKEEIETLK